MVSVNSFLLGVATPTTYSGDSMTELMEDAGTVLDKILDLSMKVINFIVSNPLTLITFILVVIGLAIGIVSKFRRA